MARKYYTRTAFSSISCIRVYRPFAHEVRGLKAWNREERTVVGTARLVGLIASDIEHFALDRYIAEPTVHPFGYISQYGHCD